MKINITLALILSVFFTNLAFGQKTLLDLRFQQREAKKKASVHAPMVSTKRFYDHRGPIRKQSVRLHPVHLLNTLRMSYEFAVAKKVAVGVQAGYQFRGENAGTYKCEVYGKYFLTYRAPVGMYVFNSHGMAHIANQTMKYGLTEVGPEERFNYSRPYLLSQKATYSTYVGSIGIGFQNVIGRRKNVIVDFGLGYQYYLLPERFNTTYSQFNAIYGNFSPSNHILGPTSPISIRWAIGYAF